MCIFFWDLISYFLYRFFWLDMNNILKWNVFKNILLFWNFYDWLKKKVGFILVKGKNILMEYIYMFIICI